MNTAIVGAVLKILLSVIGFFINKKQGNDEVMRNYIKFVESVSQSYGESARLKKSYGSQIERLKAQIKANSENQ